MTELKREIKIPEGIQVSYANNELVVRAGSNSVKRGLVSKLVSFLVQGNIINVSAKKSTKKELRMAGTVEAHLKNMFKGVKEGHVYKLKICSGHFPMNVTMTPKEVTIKNFLGESVPRKTSIPEGVKLVIAGNDVTVSGIDIELVGGFAGKLEKLTNIRGRDLRIFQDGIYIVEKDGQSVA